MGTSYLKALQLQKKLEEQAKQEAENRGKAEGWLGEIDSILEEYKKAGLDISSVEEARKNAVSYMDAKEYTKALVDLEKAAETLETLKKDQISHMISSSEDMILLSRTLGASTKKADNLIEKAEKALENDEPLEKIVKLVKDAWGEAERLLQERISGTFSAAQSLVHKAKDLGEDTDAGEILFKEAREAVDSGDYRGALEKLSECVGIVGSKVADNLRSTTDEIQKNLDVSESMDIDISKSRDELKRIEKLLDDSEFEDALKATNILRESSVKLIHDSLVQRHRDIEETLRVAKKIEADVSDIDSKVAEAKKSLNSKDYARASELMNESKEEIANACFQNVLKVISNSRGNFLTAKKLGMDMSVSIDLLNQARDALKDSRYEDSISLALKSDSEIEGKIGKFKNAEESLKKVEENMSTAQDLGIDIAFSEQLISEARKALESSDFSKALDLINKSKDKIEDAEYMKVEEAVEQAQIAITLSEKLGVDVKECSTLMESAIFHLRDKSFKDSLDISRKVHAQMTAAAKRRLLEVVEAGRIFLNENAFGDAGEAVDLLDRAEGAVEEGLLEEAFKLTEKSNEVVASLQEGRVKALLEDVDKGISFLGSENIDASKVIPGFNRASSLLKEGDYSNASEAAKDCLEKLLEIEKEAFEDIFSSAKLSAVEARRKGIDIDQPKKLLEESRDLYGMGRYQEAIKKAVDAKASSDALKETHSVAYSSIMEVASLITEAKKDGVDVKSVAKALMQAKKCLESQDYDKAISIANACKDNLDRTRHQYKAAKSLVYSQMLLTTSAKIELDVSSQRENIEKAKSLMKEKNYQDAMSLADTSVSELESMVEKHLLDIISGAETAIESARGIGIDVKSIEEMVAHAKDRMKAEDFETSYNSAKQANSTIDQLREMSQKAVLKLQEAKSAISDALNVGADVTASKILMEQAVRDIKDNHYKEAISKSDKIKETVEKAQEKRVGDMLSSIENSIKEAKNNMNTTRSEELLDVARNFLGEKKYKDALNTAMQCEGEMKNISLQHKMAEESITAARTKIEDMAKEGIPGGEAKKILEKAKESFSNKDYVSVLSLAVEAGEKAHAIRELHMSTKDVLLQSVNRIKALKEQGVDVKSAEAILSGASAEFKAQDYGKAKDYAREAVDEAEKKYHGFVRGKLEDVRKKFAQVGDMGGNPERAVSLMNDTEAALKEKEYPKVFALLDKIQIVINYEIKGAVRKKISSVEFAIDEAKAKGVDVNEASDLIHDAILGVEGGEYQKALEMADQALNMVSGAEVGRKELDDILLTTESLMAKAKKFGLDVKNANKMYEEALSLRASDIAQALSLAETAKEETQRIMDELAPRITPRVNAGTLYAGEWTTVELVLLNTGRSVAKNVKITISGVDVRGLKDVPIIIGGKSDMMTIQIMSSSSGDVSAKVKSQFESMVEKKTITTDHNITLKVEQKATFKHTKAQEAGKCSQCHSTIKQDMNIVLCDCGAIYHDGICPKKKETCDCGRSLLEISAKNI